MKSNLKLYGALICPYVQRVRFFLEEAKIPYEYQEINLLAKEHNEEWYKTINPSMKVPSLILDEKKVIVESLVINEFLCEAYYPEALPKDFFERSNIRRWICYFSDSINSSNMAMITKIREGKTDEADIEFSKLQERWSFLVENSSLTNKKFLFGDSLTLADFAILPFLNNSRIMMGKILNKDLFESANSKIKQNLTLLKKYLDFSRENTAFRLANDKPNFIPTEEKDVVIKTLGREKFSFDEYATLYYSKAFFGK